MSEAGTAAGTSPLQRWTRRGWQLVAAAVLLAALAVLVLVLRLTWDREDGFFVAGAQLADPEHLDKLRPKPAEAVRPAEVGVIAHRIVAGSGTVIGHRAYSAGEFYIVDDETYSKATVWLAGPLPASGLSVALGDPAQVRVLLSRGLSAWPARDCSGVVQDGRLSVKRKGAALHVMLLGVFEPRTGAAPDCVREPVELQFEAGALTLDQLTPWLGRAGEHPYAETYR